LKIAQHPEVVTLNYQLQNISPNNRTLCAGLRAPLEARVPLSIASQELHEIEVLVERVTRCLPDGEKPCRCCCLHVHYVVEIEIHER
jgi:hypothetical protein